jgi:hypothetical protein
MADLKGLARAPRPDTTTGPERGSAMTPTTATGSTAVSALHASLGNAAVQRMAGGPTTPAAAKTAGPAATGPTTGATRAPQAMQRKPALRATEQLQLPSGGNLEATKAVMAAIEHITPAPDGSYVTNYAGRQIVMTPSQAEQVRSAAARALQNALNRSRRRFQGAADRYANQQSVNREFWFSSHIASSFAWIRTLGRHSDPAAAIASQRTELDTASTAAQRSLGAGALVEAASHLARADAASELTARLVQAYVDQLIESAGSIIVGLEYTRDAAFITLGVLSVIVTGGAAAGVAPGLVGTGIGGLSVAGTATAISVGAPIVANVGAGIVKVVEGDSVDWGSIAVDAAVQIVLARFGGKLGEGVFGKIAGNPATRTLARQAIASLISGVATHEIGQAFTVSVHHTYEAFRGRPVTWARFIEDLTTRLTDPKGLFMAAVMSSLQFGAHVAVAKHTASHPVDTEMQLAAQKPTTPEPGPAPKPAESPVAQGAAGKHADTESTFAELKSELGTEPEAGGPIVGQKLGARSAEDPVAKALPPLPEKFAVSPTRKAELEASMLAHRRQEGLTALADEPDLQAALVSSTKKLGGKADLVDLAADSPTRMREMWEDYKVNSAKRAAEGKKPHEFADYVKARQASQHRARYGEHTDAFTRGPNEIILAAPGRENEPGIDSVSFAPGPSGGRIKLLDNKAAQQGSTIGKVSALQQNISADTAATPVKPGNLDEAIAVVQQGASQPEAPPVIKDVVLPRLQAASKAVNDHVASWQQANPGKPLTDIKLQTEIGKILDQYGIDRVVTTAGGGSNVKISAALRKQGFTQE